MLGATVASRIYREERNHKPVRITLSFFTFYVTALRQRTTVEINSGKGKEVRDDQSQDGLQLLKHVASKTQQRIKSLRKSPGAEWQHAVALGSPLPQRPPTGTEHWPPSALPAAAPVPGTEPSPAQPFPLEALLIQAPTKMGKIQLKYFPPDSQVKLVQQQLSRVKAQEAQDCIGTSRGGQGKIPFFGGKVLLYHPGWL